MQIFLLLLLLLLPLSEVAALAQAGDAEAGKTLWSAGFASGAAGFAATAMEGGSGGFSPILPGRRLTLAQFTRAIRKPWGIMPAYTENQITERDIANLHACFASLQPAAAPDSPPTAARAGARHVRRRISIRLGALQCHEPR